MGMSREHLYKAKRVNWRELPKEEWWVEGYYVKHGSRHWIYTGKIQYMYYPVCADLPTKCEVEEETVCEYTGFTDKNRRKIFEGDIVKIGLEYYEVWWNCDSSSITLSSENESRGLYLSRNETIEVTGNIFDNLELLEGVEAE